MVSQPTFRSLNREIIDILFIKNSEFSPGHTVVSAFLDPGSSLSVHEVNVESSLSVDQEELNVVPVDREELNVGSSLSVDQQERMLRLVNLNIQEGLNVSQIWDESKNGYN